MKTNEIRESYLSFFESKGHKRLPSDSLIPQNDPTLLFTGAGMNQFKDYFLGLKTDLKRAATSQKCLRTGDLDNVGKTNYHHSFFEMLGNFSFGDYLKEEAIGWAWEYLTEVLKIKPERLRVSVHEKDDEAYHIWEKKIKIRPDWITRLDDETNFWPANAPKDGPNGPCGPCSEIYFDQGEKFAPGAGSDTITSESGRFAEIWNLVFTEFDRTGINKLSPLSNKNIDTGAGLERIACVLQGKRCNFEIDIFQPTLSALREIFKKTDAKDNSSLYTIVDHSRAAFFSITDGALPSNEGRGYVIRKLIRRALWHGWRLGKKEAFLYTLLPVLIESMGKQYPELKEHSSSVTDIVKKEETRFLDTLETGLAILNEEIRKIQKKGEVLIRGEKAFHLYDTLGFPLELTCEIAAQSNLTVDKGEFENCMEKQRERAKQGSQIAGEIFVKTDMDEKLAKLPETKFLGYETCEAKGKVLFAEKVESELWVILDQTPFYGESGGQVGDKGILKGNHFHGIVFDAQKRNQLIIHRLKEWEGDLKPGKDTVEASVDASTRNNTIRHHSATHLLQSALREVLGDQVRQFGSLVNEDKLRFDFSFSRALSQDEIERVESLVNREIMANVPMKSEVTDIESAKKKGALAFFGDKYGDQVRMVSMGASKELCGGTHVKATGDIGLVKIVTESSVASGVRRIEAVAGQKALDFVQAQLGVIRNLSQDLKVSPDELGTRVKKMTSRIKELEKAGPSQAQGEKFIDENWTQSEVQFVLQGFKGVPAKSLKGLSDPLRKNKKHTFAFLLSEDNGKVSLLACSTNDLNADAGKIIKEVSGVLKGTGGGKKDMAQGGGSIPPDYDAFMTQIKEIILNQGIKAK